MEDYKPILATTVHSVFNDYVSSLQIPSIDYFAIGVQDPINVKSTSIMSRIEWQKIFKANGFAKYDPIRLAVLNSKRTIFYFDDIDPLNTLGNEIMLQRKKHEIRNGIILVDRQLTHNYMLTLATDHRKFDGKDFFIKYHEDLLRIFKDLSLIIKPFSSDYILK